MRKWKRGDMLGLARPGCVQCGGWGLRVNGRHDTAQPCDCVLRAIFRSCYACFCECQTQEKYMTQAVLDFVEGIDRLTAYSRKHEEFAADFCLISSRSLNAGEHAIFRQHFLLAADWRVCCRKLKLDRGRFFHAVYTIERKLGRAFREQEPYALFPTDEYFAGERVSPQALRATVRRAA